MRRSLRILFDGLTLLSLALMIGLFLMPQRITVGRWFIYAAYGWVDVVKYSRPVLNLRVPFWGLLLATLVLPVAWVAHRRIRTWASHRPRPRGICSTCGYDLRATPDRCPECGRIPV